MSIFNKPLDTSRQLPGLDDFLVRQIAKNREEEGEEEVAIPAKVDRHVSPLMGGPTQERKALLKKNKDITEPRALSPNKTSGAR